MLHKTFTSLLGLALLLTTALSAAAQGVLTFEKTDHEFGNVAEGNQATHEFKFKNTGDQPVVIANVQASCGCTTPDWTKTPVLPGKTGFIRASYNSAGRPGQFNKTVTVTSNAKAATTVLTIKGTVLTKDEMKANYSPAELAKSPKLVLDRNTHDFGKMEVGQQPVARFTVKNTGKSDLTFGALTSNCYCVNFKNAPKALKPGESTTVELVYSQRATGQMSDVVTLHSNDITAPDPKISLKANIVQSLSQQSMVKEGNAAVPFK
jgi:P pilus assembly chaperone PapD